MLLRTALLSLIHALFIAEPDKFIIEAKKVSPENRYIQSATLDDKPLNKPWFYHSELVDGGKLILKMGPKPNIKWGSRPEDAPPSLSSILTQEEKQKYEPVMISGADSPEQKQLKE
jgi:putative alpha-1,2-mannosidase